MRFAANAAAASSPTLQRGVNKHSLRLGREHGRSRFTLSEDRGPFRRSTAAFVCRPIAFTLNRGATPDARSTSQISMAVAVDFISGDLRSGLRHIPLPSVRMARTKFSCSLFERFSQRSVYRSIPE
jgi:hypothetical protein